MDGGLSTSTSCQSQCLTTFCTRWISFSNSAGQLLTNMTSQDISRFGVPPLRFHLVLQVQSYIPAKMATGKDYSSIPRFSSP